MKDDYAWTVPLEETDENYEYAVVRKLEDGEFGSSVITTLDKTTSSVAYIFHPEMLDEELADYQVDSIITVAIGDINTHVVIANTTEGLLYIPFSDRPEFLDIINGKIYSGSDFLSILEVYRKAGYSKKFLDTHREEITLHKAAKAAFDETGLKKLPKVKALNAEYSDLLTQKKAAYAQFIRP